MAAAGVDAGCATGAAAVPPALSIADASCPPIPVQVHNRLKGYVKTHFEHQLKCVEKGLIDPYSG